MTIIILKFQMRTAKINDKFNDLCEWIRKNGGYVHGITLRKCPGKERGIYATKRLAPNTKIFHVPKNLHLTYVGDDRFNDVDDIRAALCGKLLLEIRHQSESFWKPYLDTLPPIGAFSEHPVVCYDMEHKKWKKLCPMFRNMVKNVLNEIHGAYDQLRRVADLEKLTFNEVLYGMLLVRTRCWNKKMIPLADLFNHSTKTPQAVKFTSDGDAEYNMKQKRTLKGQQLFNRYAIKCNVPLLAQYGFIEYPTFIKISLPEASENMWLSKSSISPPLLSFLRQITDAHKRHSAVTELIELIKKIANMSILEKSQYEIIRDFPETHPITKLLCRALIDVIDICKSSITSLSNLRAKIRS